MKKIYPIRALVVLFCMAAMQMGAQLNGVYSINSSLSTGGTNFQTFTDFATAINAQGVSGAVTVNVTGGPYNEQVIFNQITGASAVNRITINGNGATLTFSSTNVAARHVIGFNGGDYFHVKDLVVTGNGTYAWLCQLWNNADYNRFTNCTFSTNITSTSSNYFPVVISGSQSSYSTLGPGGNYNVWDDCDLIGGYYGWSLYGNSGAYTTGNQIINSTVKDFYLYGIFYYYYTQDGLIANNIVECPNRTNTSTKAGIYCYGSMGTTIDGNWVRHLFSPSLQSSTGTCYAIYAGGNLESYYTGQQLPSSKPNTLKNNIISDINFNGFLYCVYGYGWDGYVYHNTIDINNPTGNSGSTTYGMYNYGYAGNYIMHVKNNIITINRGGSGTKYGYYNASGQGASSDLSFDYNDIYMNSTAGTQYYAYWTGTANNLAGMQAMGANLNGWSVDPQYASTTDFHPTNTTINNGGTPVGVVLDQLKMPRSGTVPDVGALEFLSVACSGTPNPGSVITPTYALCPGENAVMQLSNFSSDLGITYQWQSSTQSSVGLWTNVPGDGTTPLYTALSVMQNTWYKVVVTCTNSSLGASPVGLVQVAGTTTSTVPYFEGFENIPANNKLPNCSWAADNLGSLARTYVAATTLNRVPRTGSKFATFYYNPTGTRRMYTNGIWLDAGITYSASVWYTTEYYGYNNWTDLSIMLGTAQSSVGLQTIASTNGPAISNIYKSLSNTFTVATSGLYYVAIQASVTTGSSAQYLTWDDLRIEIPCSVNSPTVNVTSNQSTICVNQSAMLQASGANTYTWSTGEQTDNISVTPFYAGIASYTVTGSNTLTGCSVSMVQQLIVNPSPQVSAFAHPPVVCEGGVANLYATGANNYIWSNNQTGNVVTINPTTIGTNTFTVVGTNQFNCQGSAVAQVVVNAKPNISATSPSMICVGEPAIIVANGGQNYQILSGNSLNTTNPATVMPSSSTQYTINGTDANGCQNFTIVAIGVDICEGIAESSSLFGLRVYPNPTNANLTIELNTTAVKNVEVVDVTGRVVFTGNTSSTNLQVDLSQVANGVYYVKVKSNEDSQVIKVIKN